MPEMFEEIVKKSIDSEFYTPYPDNYKKGRTKYIVVLGTVMSGLGKGIISSSIGKLLQLKGLNVAPVKFDGYLNQDAGTLNPFRHGEVFVLNDGTESDMDLGTYERFLNLNLTYNNYLTSGKLYQKILNKERKGDYLGRDVQTIPHVTGEIKLFLRNLAVKEKPDVIILEVGGTVGDLENMFCIEAVRELLYEEGKENVCFVVLTYILEPKFLGEQKSKAAQLGIRSVLSMGIQPDIIACRASNPISQKIKEKISIFSNVKMENVISAHDVESIYFIPRLIKETGVDQSILKCLNLKQKNSALEEERLFEEWNKWTLKILNAEENITIGMIGKYTSLRDSYASIIKALEHAGAKMNSKINIKWIETTDIENKPDEMEREFQNVDGVIVLPGFGKRGSEGKISCLKYIREKDIPFLGVCYGMQMAVIEFARNVCKLKDANSTEIEPKTKNPVIDFLPEQQKLESLGGNMRLGGRDVLLKENTVAFELYGRNKIINERFRHRYEVNPKYIDVLSKNGIVFSGKHPKYNIMQVMELPNKRFFVGCQFHPEFNSKPKLCSPMYLGLVNAALKYKKSK